MLQNHRDAASDPRREWQERLSQAMVELRLDKQARQRRQEGAEGTRQWSYVREITWTGEDMMHSGSH